MTIYINDSGLYERTQDFLSSLNYPNVHMSSSEWLEKAEAYGLDEDEIAELEQHLETNNQLTRPVRFAGRQWWLTNAEIEHIEFIKKSFPDNWETQVLDRMQSRVLGYLKKDWQLTEKSKTKRSVN